MPLEPVKSEKIELLPPQLANQIAAGEVVERPSSVVKELIENSIDAQADSVFIDIEQGGHKRILIRDTGKGIAQDQLELALSRHATSKIRDINDLECITSMGFRGEALASISSVSRLVLTSRPAQQAQAWQAQTEGVDMAVSLSPAAHPIGTSIEVIDLFFNTPARRKFLRAQKTEFQHIENIVRRIALAHPQIAFTLKHNGKAVYKWSAGDLHARVQAICGASYLEKTTSIDYQHEQIHLTGWCSKIGEGWQTNDQQYIFVNHRMIKDKLVLHAIRQAYEGLLPDNQYPAYVLFLSVPADEMDVNVHPAKHEVRFHHARLVHDVIFQALSQAIVAAQVKAEQGQDSKPSEPAVNHDYIRPLQSLSANSEIASLAESLQVTPASTRMQSTASRGKSRSGADNAFAARSEAHIAEAGKHYQELMQHREADRNTLPFVRLGTLLLFEYADGLTVLPMQTVVRLGFSHDLAQSAVSQPLLMPVSLPQHDEAQAWVVEQLRTIGCSIDERHQKLILKQVPSGLRSLPWTHLFARMLEVPTQHAGEKDCINLLAKHYLEIAQLNTLNIQNIVAKIPSSALIDALHKQGQMVTESMLLAISIKEH